MRCVRETGGGPQEEKRQRQVIIMCIKVRLCTCLLCMLICMFTPIVAFCRSGTFTGCDNLHCLAALMPRVHITGVSHFWAHITQR